MNLAGKLANESRLKIRQLRDKLYFLGSFGLRNPEIARNPLEKKREF